MHGGSLATMNISGSSTTSHTAAHIGEEIATCYFKIYHGQPMHTIWRRFLERGSPIFFYKGKSPHLGCHFWKEDHALRKKIHRLPYEDTDNPLHKDDLAVDLGTLGGVSQKKKTHRKSSRFL